MVWGTVGERIATARQYEEINVSDVVTQNVPTYLSTQPIVYSPQTVTDQKARRRSIA